MASPDNEIMEIDSDEDSTPLPAKKSKNDHENKKLDDKKAIEIINLLMDEDSEDDVKSLKEEKKVGNVVGAVDVSPSKSESKIEKVDPAPPPIISDSKDDLKEEKEEIMEIKEVFTPKTNGKTMQREGVIIRNVEEITQEKPMKEEEDKKEVITLEEDEEEIVVEEVLNSEIQANRRKCLNSGCKSGVDIQMCQESHIFTFYCMKPRPKQLVCKACRQAADNHFQELTSLLKQNKPIFSAKFPTRSDVVLLDDSDEEVEADSGGEEVELDEEVSNIVNNNILLENFLQEVMGKFDISEQEKQNVDLLKQEAAKMTETIKEYDERFSKVFTSLETNLNAFYQIGVPNIVSVPPIEIVDVYEEPKAAPPLNTHLSTPKEGALSSAVMQKPLYAPRQPVAMKKVTQYGGQPTTSKTRPSVTNEKASKRKIKNGGYPKSEKTIPTGSTSVKNKKDVVPLESTLASMPPLPPYGPLQKKKLAVGDDVFVIRSTLFKAWSLARVIEFIPKPAYTESDNQVRVVYDLYKKTPPTKMVTTKLCAYREPSPVRLPVGSRIIAVYRGDEEPVEPVATDDKQQFYSGVLAEAPKMSNKYRYLVFFDDGYTQYVHHGNIRLVCETSAKVWDDVDPESRQFIKDYLTRYPERPMVKVQLDEIVKTEWNGRWWVARVQDIDGSLVKMRFDADGRTEWIYRGSTRLGPLYLEITAAKNRQTGRNRHASYLKRQAQYVEYTQNVDDNDNSDDDVQIVEPDPSQTQAAQGQVRSVARKSTANRAQPVLEGGDGGDIVYHMVGPIDASIKPQQFVLQNHPGQIVKVDMSCYPKPRQFVNHACGNHCVAWTGYTDANSKEIPGLQRPLKFGFQRLFYTKKSKPFVAYIAPCGRRLRNMDEMVKYLFKTRSELACDFFDFDPWVSCVNHYKLHSVKTSIKDLSYGKENISIECVNYVDTTYPDFVYYQTERRAMENVNLNLDPEFLSGCDCKDNCQDRSKCACWQLTINGAKGVPGSDFDENSIGYQYRRLPERVVSGIYECNSQCKCSKTCMNRVVQFPISVKLQLYKTLMKGWGIRCLHDIPQGSFICIYAGNLLTEQAANEGGKTYGDEYLAELDFVEVMENLKEDYESDAPELSDDEPQIRDNEDKKNRAKRSSKEEEEEEEEDVDDPDAVEEKRGGYEEDRTFSVSHRRLNTETDSNNMRARLRARETAKKTKDADSDRERKHSQFNAKIKESEEKGHKSVREYYDTDDCIYVMDAKNGGNIGRYMNHSCNPNCFVQNVFMDTHDLRFPWVAFFSSRFIEAGVELTWDYNYDVGSVPGKVLYCYCGEANCRRRLL